NYWFIFSDVRKIGNNDRDTESSLNNSISAAFLLDNIAEFVSDRGSRSVFGEMDPKELKNEYARCELGDGYYFDIESDELKKINKEIVAWIQLKDTQIDYPVLWHKGDDAYDQYYLNHNYKGDYDSYGCIFFDWRCTKARIIIPGIIDVCHTIPVPWIIIMSMVKTCQTGGEIIVEILAIGKTFGIALLITQIV
ncbi:MAG: hypothetical protein II287_09090, partial [Bacteroidaceae bacterium]|nr:hypothetical protein [Bacteroidaceae bacterium]